MPPFPNFFCRLPSLKEVPPKTYSVHFSLHGLTPGVDNIRHDVHLSEELSKTTGEITLRLIARHSGAEDILFGDTIWNWAKDKDKFKRLCSDVMLGAVTQAKVARKIEIDFLAQTAIVKMITSGIRVQYDVFIQRLRDVVRKQEMSYWKEYHKRTSLGYDSLPKQDFHGLLKLQEKLLHIQRNKQLILHSAGRQLFECLSDIQQKNLKEIREANFGIDTVLPDEIFSNPILYSENPSDQFLLIEEYVLMGNRFEDLDRYNIVLPLIRSLLTRIAVKYAPPEDRSSQAVTIPSHEDRDPEKRLDEGRHHQVDGWIKQVDNMDTLFNYAHSRKLLKILKKRKGNKSDLLTLKKRARDQRRLLRFFYREFEESELIQRITAAFEMKFIFMDYCPPLSPQQVLQFLIEPKVRKGIISNLKRMERSDGKSFSLTPLRKVIKNLDRISRQQKEEYLLEFLKGFARYHRDLQNFNMLREAMDLVNLTSEQSVINLSRANNTLYEFLLPHEHAIKERPIINHVIIKANLRGSTEITLQMKARGLNPASYFSLNFFEPITNVLSEYGAVKVFIEGDAIIASIFEHEDTPAYCVARGCGLAIKMLLIIRQYNAKAKTYRLPPLEVGIGISYYNAPPAFLFDGDRRIMVSSAISVADRLSGCSKSLRTRFAKQKRPFNLYVFQESSKMDTALTADDLILRYNVNGIELDLAGFKKLSEEIDVKAMECVLPELQEQKINIYTGKFPTVAGRYQRLVIREGSIGEVSPTELTLIAQTPNKYYEVCTHPKLYDYVKKML